MAGSTSARLVRAGFACFLEKRSMKGTRYVHQAQIVLLNTHVPPRERLYAAAKLFWKSVFYETLWPDTTRAAAAAIIHRLFAKGPIDRTVALMDDDTVGVTLGELDGFVRQFLATAPAPCPEDTPVEAELDAADQKS